MTIRGLREAIEALPSDRPKRIAGKRYATQKEHWLGWLREYHGPGAYGRVPGQAKRDARFAYNHVVEPGMLSWLIDAAGVDPMTVASARRAARKGQTLGQKSAAIRKRVPWEELFGALLLRRPLVRTGGTFDFVCVHPHGSSAIEGYRLAARHFGLRTMEDPTTVGTDTCRLLIHEDVRKLRAAARVLSRAYDSGDDDAIEEAELWLAFRSGVHWFDHDWSFWDIEQDEGALGNLGWRRTILAGGSTYLVSLKKPGERGSSS